MVGQMQNMLQPLLNQAAASANAGDPSLQPAISQILSGVSDLTKALGPPGTQNAMNVPSVDDMKE